MTNRFLKVVRDEQRRDVASDASSSSGPRMIVDDAHDADIRPAVRPDRRLRNLILLANALAWVAIIVTIRWLFF